MLVVPRRPPDVGVRTRGSCSWGGCVLTRFRPRLSVEACCSRVLVRRSCRADLLGCSRGRCCLVSLSPVGSWVTRLRPDKVVHFSEDSMSSKRLGCGTAMYVHRPLRGVVVKNRWEVCHPRAHHSSTILDVTQGFEVELLEVRFITFFWRGGIALRERCSRLSHPRRVEG